MRLGGRSTQGHAWSLAIGWISGGHRANSEMQPSDEMDILKVSHTVDP